MCAGGALCGFCLDVSSSFPCRRGPRRAFPQVILLFASPLAFDHLLEFLLVVSFLFLLSLVTKSCVLSIHSSRGRLRTMCGSRTSGWSLPGVMSDWQRCVDWLLANYCRCRLRLDWCWWRWRTSTKGRHWWGLQVWTRQVGLVRGTRWPAESSADPVVARTAGRSRGRFLCWASKPRSSRDYVGAESWVAIDGGYTEFAGFAVVHQKTTGLLGWAIKPRSKTWRGGAATQAGSTAQEGRSDYLGRSNRPGGLSDRPDRCRWESSKQRTHVGIARLASRLSKVAVAGYPSDGENLKTSNFSLVGHVSLVI
jgi:hypothetical protein